MTAVLAPGKAILCGEYAVLHGAPAISVAVDRCARAVAGKRGERTPFVEAALRRAGELLQRHKMRAAPADVAVDTSALYEGGRKLGLGSSAAVTAAVIGAAWHAGGGSLDDRRALFEAADEAHAEAQGTRGSGVDVATAIYGGAIRFQRKSGAVDITAVDLPEGVGLTFIFAGRSASTPELIARVKTLAEADPQRHADAIARRHGGAAKPSGAGGGDLGVAFTASPQATRALRDELTARGLAPLSLHAPSPGLRLELP